MALEPPVARALRDVAHYLSVVSTQRVTLSDALGQLIRTWLHAQGLDPAAEAFIRNHLDGADVQLGAKAGR